MSWDSVESALGKLRSFELPHWQNYYGFYSSWYDGYFNEPWAMLLPMDDHGFHRGDGVFEAVRVHSRAFIDLQAHLKRLENSASAIGMKLPKTLAEIESICCELGRRANQDTGILRLFVTRGPGGFSPSPAEVIGHQLYAIFTKMKPPSPEAYENGVSAMFSTVGAKDAFWSQIKSCNYLQNVMMKKESNEKGFDFAVCLNDEGRLCEGATENLLLVSQNQEIIVPKFDYTLRGTTVSEVMKIADELVKKGDVHSVRLGDVSREDLLRAREAAFVGTTLGVLPVTSIDRRPIADGKVGPIAAFLHRKLMERLANDSALRTRF